MAEASRWRAIARSAAGPRHRRQDSPCQDRCGYRRHGPWLFGAVADGAGTAARADEGAALAVEVALASLETAFDGLSWARTPTRAELHARFAAVHETAAERLLEHARRERAPLEAFATTLLAVVATPGWCAGMQVGDGFAVMRDDGGAYHLVCGPDRGEYVNLTVFVGEPDAAARLQVGLIERPPAFVCLSTDGLERLCLRAGGEPHAGFFDPLLNYMGVTADPEADDAYLTGFLASERLDARTDDDRTLLLAVRAPA